MDYAYLHYYNLPQTIVNKIHNDNELIDVISKKFKINNAKKFIEFTKLSLEQWAHILPVSKSTLQRNLKNNNKLLEFEITEPLLEIGEIYYIGLSAFDKNKDRLNKWFMTENSYFKGKKPIDIMNSHKGRDMIKRELYRIEYGVFS